MDLYSGPLLEHSEAPALRAERDELDATLRGAVLESRNAELIWRFAQTPVGAEDLEIFERLAALLPGTDSRRSAVAARLHRLTLQG
jgi:hypothetical protein